MLDLVGEAALRVALLTALVQCAVWVLRVRTARSLLPAWTAVLVASIAMPVLPLVSPMRLPIASAVSRPLTDGVFDLLTPDRPPAASDDIPVQQDAPPPVRLWLTAIYVIVGAGIVLRTMLGLGLSLRLLARAAPINLAWAAGRRVRISSDVTGPVTIAQFILLPVDAIGWSAEMQQAVLAHERAHVARWDFAMLVVSQVNRALFWFNPLSWWLHRRLVTLTELASDDQAMAATQDRLRYAEILLEMGRRSGATSRGPAMARPSTLVYRIERIVQGRTELHRISRPQQMLIAAGVTGLSLAVASLASNPAVTLSPPERTVAPEISAPPISSLGQTDEAAARVDPPMAGRAAILPSPAKPSVQPGRSARPAVTSAPVHTASRRKPMIGGQIGPGTGPENTAAEKPRDTQNVMVDVGVPSPIQGAPGLQSYGSDLEEIVGSTCTGTIAVGPRAWRSYGRQPDVAAGELVPARAQFFRRADGTAWVRFDAFGQPPLDLPARFGRNGIAWTGQYGISYVLQRAGGNRLAGLAALIANDSAGLDFACGKSAHHLL